MDVNPFTISPHPEGLYITESLSATIAKVSYVVENMQGLTVIFGDAGTGKTSLLRYLQNQYAERPEYHIASLPNPSYKTDTALLRAICGEFGLPVRRSMMDQEQTLRGFLVEHYRAGGNAVVFVDEAQIIAGRVLELIRLLLNLDMDRHKMIQVVLAGQLELRDRLRDPTKKALRSRIFITSTLVPLTLDEAVAMIAHRCAAEGEPNPFPLETVEAVWAEAKGIPREVLKLCGLTWDTAKRSGLSTVPLEAVAFVAPDVE